MKAQQHYNVQFEVIRRSILVKTDYKYTVKSE